MALKGAGTVDNQKIANLKKPLNRNIVILPMPMHAKHTLCTLDMYYGAILCSHGLFEIYK